MERLKSCDFETVAKMGLVNELSVRGGEGEGVVAGFEGYGQVPDQSAAGAVGGGEDVVGAGRNVGGDGGFAVAVEGGRPDEVGVHGGSVGGAALWRTAVGHIGHQGSAGSYVGGDGRANLAQGDIVALAHQLHDASGERVVGDRQGRADGARHPATPGGVTGIASPGPTRCSLAVSTPALAA